MINRGTSSLGSSLGDLQQPLERRQRRSAAVQTQPDQLHAGTTWPARKGVRKEPLPGPEDQGRALGKDDSVWGQNSGKFCSICLLLNTCVRLAHLLPVYTSALKLRFSKYDIAIVLYLACITSTWTITTSNNTNSNINPGLVLKQEGQMASPSQDQSFSSLRNDVTGRLGSRVRCPNSHPLTHAGPTIDRGSRSGGRRESHFRPWLTSPKTKESRFCPY